MTTPGDAKQIFEKSTYAYARRSTRVEFVTPVILTGRGALGRQFSEETETSVVNLHGAKVHTKNAIKVGAILKVKVPSTDAVADAVCVWVGERVTGRSTHEIAIQLVKPANIWGLENPPSDWQRCLAVRPQGPAPTLEPSSNEPRKDAGLKATATETASGAPPPQELAEAARDLDLAKADVNGNKLLTEYEERLELSARRIEGRVHECVEQALKTLGSKIEALRVDGMGEIVNEAVRGFQNKIDSISADAEARYTGQIQGATKKTEDAVKTVQSAAAAVLQDVRSSLQTLRADAVGEMVNEAVRGFQNKVDLITTDAEARYAGRGQEITERWEADLMRDQSAIANEMAQRLLQDFRQKINAILKDAETGVGDRVERALEDFSGALEAIREGFTAELSAGTEQAARSAEASIRSRVAAMISALQATPDAPTTKNSGPK